MALVSWKRILGNTIGNNQVTEIFVLFPYNFTFRNSFLFLPALNTDFTFTFFHLGRRLFLHSSNRLPLSLLLRISLLLRSSFILRSSSLLLRSYSLLHSSICVEVFLFVIVFCVVVIFFVIVFCVVRGLFEMNCLFLSGDFKFQVSPKVLISCPRSTPRG